MTALKLLGYDIFWDANEVRLHNYVQLSLKRDRPVCVPSGVNNNNNNNKLYLHDHNKVLQYCKSYLKLLIDSL